MNCSNVKWGKGKNESGDTPLRCKRGYALVDKNNKYPLKGQSIPQCNDKTYKCVPDMCKPKFIKNSDKEFDPIINKVKGEIVPVKCHDGYIFGHSNTKSHEIICDHGDFDKDTQLYDNNNTWFNNQNNMTWFIKNDNIDELCKNNNKKSDCTPIKRCMPHTTVYSSVNICDTYNDNEKNNILENIKGCEANKKCYIHEYKCSWNNQIKKKIKNKALIKNGECRFREKVTNNICKPDQCDQKIVDNSDRAASRPLPGKGNCHKSKTNKEISVNSFNEPINNIHDCACYTKKNCRSCTDDKRCSWCNKKGSEGCYSKNTEYKELCKSNWKNFKGEGKCIYKHKSQVTVINNCVGNATCSRDNCTKEKVPSICIHRQTSNKTKGNDVNLKAYIKEKYPIEKYTKIINKIDSVSNEILSSESNFKLEELCNNVKLYKYNPTIHDIKGYNNEIGHIINKQGKCEIDEDNIGNMGGKKFPQWIDITKNMKNDNLDKSIKNDNLKFLHAKPLTLKSIPVYNYSSPSNSLQPLIKTINKKKKAKQKVLIDLTVNIKGKELKHKVSLANDGTINNVKDLMTNPPGTTELITTGTWIIYYKDLFNNEQICDLLEGTLTNGKCTRTGNCNNLYSKLDCNNIKSIYGLVFQIGYNQWIDEKIKKNRCSIVKKGSQLKMLNFRHIPKNYKSKCVIRLPIKRGETTKYEFGIDNQLFELNDKNCKDFPSDFVSAEWVNAGYCENTNSVTDKRENVIWGNYSTDMMDRDEPCNSTLFSTCKVDCNNKYAGGGNYVCHYDKDGPEKHCKEINDRYKNKKNDKKFEGDCTKHPYCIFNNNSCKVRKNNGEPVHGSLDWIGSKCYKFNDEAFHHSMNPLPPLNELFPPFIRILLISTILILIVYLLPDKVNPVFNVVDIGSWVFKQITDIIKYLLSIIIAPFKYVLTIFGLIDINSISFEFRGVMDAITGLIKSIINLPMSIINYYSPSNRKTRLVDVAKSRL